VKRLYQINNRNKIQSDKIPSKYNLIHVGIPFHNITNILLKYLYTLKLVMLLKSYLVHSVGLVIDTFFATAFFMARETYVTPKIIFYFPHTAYCTAKNNDKVRCAIATA
jgi:hypothetical protein